MADRVEVFDCLIPAGTPLAAPVIVDMTYPQGVPVRVQVVIPDGVAGLAGFQIAYGAQPVIPVTVDTFITGNNEVWTEDLAGYPTGGGWALIGYNLDAYDHRFHVRWSVNEITDPTPTTVLPVPVNFADTTPTADTAAPVGDAVDTGDETAADTLTEPATP